jgi:hypothetical protein
VPRAYDLHVPGPDVRAGEDRVDIGERHQLVVVGGCLALDDQRLALPVATREIVDADRRDEPAQAEDAGLARPGS